jgi:uncharacterized protein (DUF433 family)
MLYVRRQGLEPRTRGSRERGSAPAGGVYRGVTMNRIAIDHRIIGGVPCVRGTRVPVATVLGLLAEGFSPSQVSTHYPQLAVDDVLACLRYAASVVNERTLPLQQHE